MTALAATSAIALACTKTDEDPVSTGSGESNIEESADGVFKSTSDFAFELEAPFAQLITRYRNGQADPPKPKPDAGVDAAAPRDLNVDKPEFSEPGHLVVGGKTLDVRVAIRGNTSPKDCAFPKYKVELADKKQAVGTPFQGNKKFRVNSHCGSGGPNDRAGTFQRIQNEISPIREELVYRLLRAAGVPTYRTRLAKISYRDTSAASPMAPMDRHGLVIESGDVAAKRFADAGLIDRERGIYINDPNGRPTSSGANIAMMKDDDVAVLFLAEALAANMDWQFWGTNPGSLWNVDVFGVPNEAPQLPIPQDFDLASAVHAMRDPAGEVASQMSKFRSQFSSKPDVAKRAAEAFKSKKAAIEKELADVEKAGIAAGRLPSTDGVTSTDPGFVNAHKEVEAFFALDELK
jgi:hypothetical protein